jgi:hypothetical protein
MSRRRGVGRKDAAAAREKCWGIGFHFRREWSDKDGLGKNGTMFLKKMFGVWEIAIGY